MKHAPDISALLPDEATIRARRDVLMDAVNPSGPRHPRRRGSRARRLVIGIAALLVLGGGAALAAGVFSADDIAVEAGVSCHNRAALNTSAAIFSAAADPVAKCARTWREGVMTGGASTEVPHLVACTAEDRPVMVFPGPDTVCEQLGLMPLPSDYAAAGRAHARAYRALFLLRTRDVPTPSSVCPSPQAKAAFARNLLSRTHPDVPVEIEGGEPCGGGYELAGDHGDRIAVLTVSRARDRVNSNRRSQRREMVAVQAILAPVFGHPPRYRRARVKCQDPQEFAAAARRALARAGRRDIPVEIEGKGECVSLSARYAICCTTANGTSFVATLMTMTLAEWRQGKREARKWKALREAANDVPAR